MLFAEVASSHPFGTFLLYAILFFGFIGGLLKRVDKGGKVKQAARKAAFRGGVEAFKYLRK